MSAVTERIAYYWLGRGESDFLTGRADFTPQDQPLLDAGVFRLSKEEIHDVFCPFGCGDIEEITLLPRRDGDFDRVVICRHGEGDAFLKPEDYQLMEFDPDAYARYCGGRPQTKGAARISRSTPFMKKQRDAVLHYLAKCNRKPSSVKVEDCNFVWNLPAHKKTYDRHAKYTDHRRGYGDPLLLCKGIRHEYRK